MFSAMIKKEFLLVLRDKHALAVLFIMPAIFILVMSIALRDQFTQDAINFKVYISDLDKSAVSKNLIKKIEADNSLHVVDQKEGAEFIVVIPKGYYKPFRFSRKEMKKLELIVEDSVKNDLLEIFKSKMLKQVVALKVEYIKKKLKRVSTEGASALDSLGMSSDEFFDVHYNRSVEIPNSTQQSVPAWIVFGMFFIIIPMSTIYINERKQNTLTRLSSMNISLFSMALSKSIPYLVINHIQVWIMIAVGVFVVPFFDTPALEINGSLPALEAVSVSLSIAAIGLCTFIAVSATSSEQATTIGGILNILLGAVGGVMIPKFIMPDSMQTLANISPMSWGLDGFLDIFLRAGDITMVADESLLLLTFGSAAFIASIVILQMRLAKGL